MTTEWEILLPTAIDPAGPESLVDIAHCTGMDEYASPEAALADVARYDAVIVRTARLDAEVIDRADRLRVIAKHGTGLDNVDVDAASGRGIVVCNTPDANTRSVAEHTLALLFGVRRHLHTADRHVRNGGWDRSAFTGRELADDTLGLLGFGNIARSVADLAQGVGMDVVVYDPYVSADAVPAEITLIDSVPDLCDRADAISLHVPLTDDTRHLVGRAELDRLGGDGVLVNTARGAVVDEDALVEALAEGMIAGAGLDTFESEPPGADHPLASRDDVLLTPHVGATTEQALVRMSQQAADNVRTVYEGGVPDSTVNREALEAGR
ncbi:hydroxyacid dehydrogenase [Salinirubrum litoreum]|uniref:Hydroxyacid dehydrogenase n=1 Tax=Salinirubrum litoreum TaxID=1126234 RepID=A0ABD5R8W5_9EURY|nr:hydroxyacid dehydrogenase [Salinirubrum litoreum]